jgi:4-hydroxy-tetrahydrodipicolinate synthase
MPTTSFPRGGILAALWIPTDASGALDRAALAAHIDWLRARGVAGVLALGSTGEFPRFSVAERKTIIDRVISAAGDLPVLVNISDIQLAHAIELGHHARAAGAAGIALMAPWFFPNSQADLLEFFLRAADAVKLPTLLYNFPELAGTRIALETVRAFGERANLAGIKQSGAEFTYHPSLIELGRQMKFSVFSGADTRLPEVFKLGAAGCIGGMVNFVPELMVEIYRLCQSARFDETDPAAARMKIAGAILDRLTFPLNVAAGMEARGLAPGHPKMVVSHESAAIYRAIVADLQTCFKDWNLPLAHFATTPTARVS